MVVLIDKEISEKQLEQSKEEYDEYIKIVVDVKREVLTLGGEWHADGEKALLDNGSMQGDLLGGGVNLETKEIDFNSLINIRSGVNESMEVVDAKVRSRMSEIIKKKLERWL